MMTPIGYMRSPFLFKNGTPRQATVCSQARGVITIEKSVFNNPEHSLEELEEFTHVWILFIFHQNNNTYTKAKVKPPRLNGKRVGLFSTRSPYRPNNVGLTLAKIESLSGATLTVSGIDLIDGTPVIDIKPYIAQYDCPSAVSTHTNIQTNGDDGSIKEGIDSDGVKTNDSVNDLSEDVTIHREKELNIPTTGVDTESRGDAINEGIDVVGVKYNETTTVNDLSGDVKTGREKELDELLKTTCPQSEKQQDEIDKSTHCHGMVKYCIGDDTSLDCVANPGDKGKHADSSCAKQHSNTLPVSSSVSNSNSSSNLDLIRDTSPIISVDKHEHRYTHPEFTEANSHVISPDKHADNRTNAISDSVSDIGDGKLDNSPSNLTNLIEDSVIDKGIDQIDNNLSILSGTKEDCASTKKTDRNPVSKSAQWIETPPIQSLTVRFTPSALEQLGKFSLSSQSNDLFKLKLLKSSKDAEDAICNILTADPRSTYRRKHCKDSLYYFTLDTIHVTCWFDESNVEVVRVKPACLVEQCKHKYT